MPSTSEAMRLADYKLSLGGNLWIGSALSRDLAIAEARAVLRDQTSPVTRMSRRSPEGAWEVLDLTPPAAPAEVRSLAPAHAWARLLEVVAPAPVTPPAVKPKRDAFEMPKWREAATRAALASTGGRPSRWPRLDGEVLISPDPAKPGHWRVTDLDASGKPSGYIEAASEEEAFREARFHNVSFPEDTPAAIEQYALVDAEWKAKAAARKAAAVPPLPPEQPKLAAAPVIPEPMVPVPAAPVPEPVVPARSAGDDDDEKEVAEAYRRMDDEKAAAKELLVAPVVAEGDAEARDTRHVREVVIAPNESSGGKGRSFRGLLLASVEADTLWDGGATDTDAMRPVWAMFAGSDQELRPFAMNLKMGRKAIFSTRKSGYSRSKEEKLELLKSAGYEYAWQREPEGSVVTTFLPDLFSLDPGMIDPKGIKFIMLPTVQWESAQKIDAAPIVKHARGLAHTVTDEQLAEWTPLAFLFAAYLDRRTRCPIPPDGRFHLQLMLATLRDGLSSWSCPRDSYRHEHAFGEHPTFHFTETGTDAVGLMKGLAFRSKHDDFEKLLADEVSLFFRTTRGR